MTHFPGHLWHDNWTALSGPLSHEPCKVSGCGTLLEGQVARQSHMETLIVYKLGSNQNYYTFAWMLPLNTSVQYISLNQVFELQVFQHEILGRLLICHLRCDRCTGGLALPYSDFISKHLQFIILVQGNLLNKMIFISNMKLNVQ